MDKYISKYSNGKSVSAAQYICEIICERIAKRTNKDLHYRFWISKEWEKEFKGQIASANKLLKKYSSKRIISALKSRDGLRIYSLRAPHLSGIIDKTPEPNPINDDKDIKQIDRVLLNKGRGSTPKTKTVLDKLKELDNGTA